MMDVARLKIWARLIHMGRRTLEDIPEEDRGAVEDVYNEMYPAPIEEPAPTEETKETEDGNTDDNIEHDSGRSDAEDLCESE